MSKLKYLYHFFFINEPVEYEPLKDEPISNKQFIIMVSSTLASMIIAYLVQTLI